MNNIHKASFLRAFAGAESKKTRGWQFADGVIIFPEAKCPYCHVILKSPNIWVAKNMRVLGRWKLEKGKIVKQSVPHPHVSGGAICMGNQKIGEEMSALFLGLSPGYHYREVMISFLKREFDHVCRSSSDEPSFPFAPTPLRRRT